MKKVFLILLISGIILRFVMQFVFPVFNVDEIALGNNIKHLSFVELLYPLDFYQSAPPLYLWLQKIFIQVFPFSFWINIKILSFISSVLGVILFYVFIKRNNYAPIFLLLFIILLFNPFIVYNSITVKQYTIDLTGVIFLLVYFKSKIFKKYNWCFFLIWGLMSNIGLFACCGYLIYGFFTQRAFASFTSFLNYIKENILTILTPVPYVIYFFWFMNQKGAKELQAFMVQYWSGTFVPLNGSIFKYLLYTIHGLWIYILNSFEIWGVFMMLLMVPFFLVFYKKRVMFRDEIALLFCIVLVHLTLNVFHMYPFSDRLYLYISPFLILILGSSIVTISDFTIVKKHFQKIYVLVSIITLFLYSLYTPANDNNVYTLYEKLNEIDVNEIYFTKKSIRTTESFNAFTDNKFSMDKKILPLDSELDKSRYIVSRVAKKTKMNVTAKEELEIQNLLSLKRIEKIDCVNGYNIYIVKK
ncbi:MULTISPECIES: glycosyltransferase family 39 protein [Flavobacterium]|uniref:glycosyltransferase family 39 protein n=1 Tax=Flavobacterium TaxID=237 RepID=UPI0011837F35|nr:MULTISPECIES: glycosyltransferase family 39 protein [Flavobacterium]MCR4031199.1 glycosyltransferase family 39 protein [Flavobacterium panacis]